MHIDGTWSGVGRESDGESVPVTVVFTTGDQGLGGYTLNDRGEEVRLRDVRLDGGAISFWFQNGDITVRVQGTATVGEMHLRGVASIGITIDVALTRAT
jgi:hypothetical protein